MATKVTGTAERTLDSIPRLSRLHDELLNAKKEVCVQRARYLTEYMKGPDAWFEPPAIRRAGAVAHILRNLEIKIYPDELLVGGITGKRVGAAIYPEFIGLLIWPELEELRGREVDPIEITDEEIRDLDEEIFPFWQGKMLADYADRYASPPTPVSLLEKFGFFLLTEAGGISHTAPDTEKLLKTGLQGIMDEARVKIDEIDTSTGADPEELRKRSFYRAVAIACEGVIEYARRCRQEALRLAGEETDSIRKAELTEIARICGKVPAGPAESFHEALQSLWFLQIALHQENYEQELCQGRLDQYLYPYYQRDLETGALTEERAIELIGCLFIKMSEFCPYSARTSPSSSAGSPQIRRSLSVGLPRMVERQ